MMARLNLILLAILVVCALSVVTSQHKSRKLYVELQKEQELAKQLEAKVGVPVYYYLMKHYGVSDKRDRQRRCPSCRGRWLLPESLHRFLDFRCERCRLVSNVAFDVRISRT